MGAKPYGIVYRITDTVNGKSYIGQTKHSLAARWKNHQRCEHCTMLYRAIRKHGAEAFRVVQVAVAYSAEELNRLEAEHIASLKTLHPCGYNLKTGGDGGAHSDESKKLISVAGKRRFANPEERAKQSERVKRYFADPERRARHAEQQKRILGTPEVRAKISAGGKRRFEANPEERAKYSEIRKRHFANPKKRAEQSAAQKLRFERPEEKAKHLAAMRSFRTPEFRAKQSAATKRYFAENPDARAKTSAATKAGMARKKLVT